MGLGPWYRLGLSLGNCLILVAIIETAITFNLVCHGMASGFVDYMYGVQEQPPKVLAEFLKANPQYTFLVALYVLQILFDLLLWLSIIFKVNKHILLVWVLVTIARTWMASYLGIREEWGKTFDGYTAIIFILSFLWGTAVFFFKIVTGTQALIHAACDETNEKIHPAGEGIKNIRAYFTENLKQLSLVLLISEIVYNVQRAFNNPETAFLMEAKNRLFLNFEVDEYGNDISILTIAINAIGLILLAVKSMPMRRSWIAAYVITILIHFCLFVYVVIDWTASAHPQMFNGFVFVSLMHLIYKAIILYIYFKTGL